MLLCVERPKVLVVDDEENIRFLVASALLVQGVDVTVVDNGADALKQCRSTHIDLSLIHI